jgi:hypothetical protein
MREERLKGRKIKRQKYETEKRKRDFIPSWTTI